MSRTRSITVAAAVLTAVLLPAATGPAQAAPLVQQHYHDVYDVLLPDPDDPTGSFCGGRLVDVPLHGEVDGYFSVKSHGDDAVAYFADRFRSTLTYTNPQTGLTYTVVRVHQTKDLRITDNVDGTQTLVGLNTGSMWVYGPDGALIARRTGRSFDTFLVDTMGTSDPFDDQLTEVGDPATAGMDTTSGDFCADFFAATHG